MDGDFLRHNVQEDYNRKIRDLVQLLRNANIINNDQAPQFQQLIDQIQHPVDQQQAEIDNFIFVVPNQDMNDVLAAIGSSPPEEGYHFRNQNGILFRNGAPQAMERMDPDLREIITRQNNVGAENLANLVLQARNAQTALNNRLRTQPPQWIKIQRSLPNDTRREDTQITFIDNNRNLPDWFSIIHKIKAMGEELGYNLQHYKNVLDRFVGYFNPELKATTDDLQALDLAKFLLKIAMPAPKFDRLHQNIQKLSRQPHENIRNVAAKLHGMVSAFYSNKPEAEREPLINRLMIQGLTHFTTGTTNAKLISALEFAQINNETPNWNSLLDSVANSEQIGRAHV